MARWFPDTSLTRTSAYRLAATAVVTILVVQMITTVAGAALASRQVQTVALDTFGYVGELTAGRVSRSAEAAGDVAENTASTMEVLGPNLSRDSLEELMLRRLEQETEVNGTYIGWPDGEYLVLRRDGDGYRIQSGGGELGPRTTTRILDGSFVVQSEEVVDSDYDPRTRPWYLSGSTAPATRWTQPYIDYSSAATLVSASHAARDGGELTAVVGADLNLTELAVVLDGIPFGEGAEAFVLSQDLEVIAAPTNYRDQLHDVTESTGSVPHASDVGLTLDAARVEPGAQRFERRFDRVTLDRGFTVEEGLSWRLHIRASDGEISSGLGGLAGTGFVITGVSLVIVIGAGAAVWWARRPIARLREQAMTDPLTGLLNRHEFYSRGLRVMKRAIERGDVVMVTVLDLDEFKNLNDSLGHDEGDRALIAVAAGMNGSARAGDLAARTGGDEFAMLQVLRDGDLPATVAQRMRDAVEEEIHARVDASRTVGVTAGYAVGAASEGDLDMLVMLADRALVTGKRVEKGRIYASPASAIPTDRRSGGGR